MRSSKHSLKYGTMALAMAAMMGGDDAYRVPKPEKFKVDSKLKPSTGKIQKKRKVKRKKKGNYFVY